MKPLTALQESLKKRLSGGRFRQLNEDLYTQPGHASFSFIKENPTAYASYHEGYRRQVESWPSNPLDAIINECKSEATRRIKSQKGGIKAEILLTVADFGCGEARLSRTLSKVYSSNVLVHSFDLAKPIGENAALVTPCDMAKVPLDSMTVDIAIFCLSLMGTNFGDFIREADRVLKSGGRLLIAEVKSRFQRGSSNSSSQSRSSGGKRKRDEVGEEEQIGDVRKIPSATSSLDEFIKSVEQLGYIVDKVDDQNSHFILAFFRKTNHTDIQKSNFQGRGKRDSGGTYARERSGNTSFGLSMKPCVYKKR